jgi:hypothetical protein
MVFLWKELGALWIKKMRYSDRGKLSDLTPIYRHTYKTTKSLWMTLIYRQYLYTLRAINFKLTVIQLVMC